jgi:anthranilate phosphoribosyltransferase
LREGLARAKESLESGAALRKLDELVEFSGRLHDVIA